MVWNTTRHCRLAVPHMIPLDFMVYHDLARRVDPAMAEPGLAEFPQFNSGSNLV